MPYIAFELDALNKAPEIARATGAEEDHVIAGLLRMWAACFREKIDTLPRLRVAGFFRQDLAEALAVFGFLEAVEGGFRVRGAARYLRLAEARSRGGKAASGNLRRGQVQPETSRKPAGPQPEVQPRLQPESSRKCSPGSAPALSPNTEHRAPSTEHQKDPPPLSLLESDGPSAADRIKADFAELAAPDLPRWRDVTDARRKLVKAALKRRPLPEWREVFARTQRSRFLRGVGKAGAWRADLDWLLAGDNGTKVLEGKYDDDGPAADAGPPAETCTEPGCASTDGARIWGRFVCYGHQHDGNGAIGGAA